MTILRPTTRPFGFVYLIASQQSPLAPALGELSIGIILDRSERGHGLAYEVLDGILAKAFDGFLCQRVQANMIDGPLKGDLLKLFTKLSVGLFSFLFFVLTNLCSRFGHEGTRRRSFFCPFTREWKDTTCLGILATDWVIRTSIQPAPPSLWDEMFLRHDRERDALLRWDQGIIDEQRRLLRRTGSMETIRDFKDTNYESVESASERESMEPEQRVVKGDLIELNDDARSDYSGLEASDPEYQPVDSDDEAWSSDDSEASHHSAASTPSSVGGPWHLASVTSALGNLSPHYSDGYASSSEGSQWDMLETSSSASFDSVSDTDFR